jgi:hypothetical protein
LLLIFACSLGLIAEQHETLRLAEPIVNHSYADYQRTNQYWLALACVGQLFERCSRVAKLQRMLIVSKLIDLINNSEHTTKRVA